MLVQIAVFILLALLGAMITICYFTRVPVWMAIVLWLLTFGAWVFTSFFEELGPPYHEERSESVVRVPVENGCGYFIPGVLCDESVDPRPWYLEPEVNGGERSPERVLPIPRLQLGWEKSTDIAL